MRAAVLESYGNIAVREREMPVVRSQEVLLRVGGCGVCGTDVHLASGEVPLAKPPVVLGHEIAATLEDPGRFGDRFRVGEPVVVDPVIGCGDCEFCRQGRTNLCPSPTIVGYVRSGGFGQYLAVPAAQVYRVPATLGKKAGILVETLACVLHGYGRLDIRPGSTVLILGAGTVGLLWLQLLKHSLTTYIIQTDRVASRVELAKTLGADFVFNRSHGPLAGFLSKHGIEGFDLIVDATGQPEAIQEALPFLGKGAILMLFGVCPEHERLEISPYEMFLKEQTLLASKMPPGSFEQAIRLLAAGAIDAEALVNRILPLDQAGEALRMFVEEKDKAVKMMIDPWLVA